MTDLDQPPRRGADPLEAFEKFLPLALSIARKYGRKFPFLNDEFESAALWRLWKLLPRVDAMQNPFGFVKTCVTFAMIRVTVYKAGRDEIAFQFNRQPSDEVDAAIHRVVDRATSAESEIEFADLVGILPPKHRRVIEGLHRDGFTCRGLRQRERMSLNTVLKYKNEGHAMLRNALG